MNEDFMRQFQKIPDSILLEKIHVRLERRERAQKYKYYSIHSVLVLMLMFGMLMTFSATARAVFAQSIEQPREFLICYIGGFNPVGRHIASNPVNCNGDGILTIIPSENLSLEEAQARFKSPIVLPAYIPPGFERRADSEFFNLTDQPALVIMWERKDDIKRIKLLVSQNSVALADYAKTLGKGAITETTLNGKRALIVRGVWNIGVTESDFVTTAVMWRYDENTVYTLMSMDLVATLDELIKMAESIP